MSDTKNEPSHDNLDAFGLYVGRDNDGVIAVAYSQAPLYQGKHAIVTNDDTKIVLAYDAGTLAQIPLKLGMVLDREYRLGVTNLPAGTPEFVALVTQAVQGKIDQSALQDAASAIDALADI